jgi:hypothetical protein
LLKVQGTVQVPLSVLRTNPWFDKLMLLLRNAVGDKRNQMWPRQLANLLWALGKIGVNDDDLVEPLMEKILQVICLHLPSMEALDK